MANYLFLGREARLEILNKLNARSLGIVYSDNLQSTDFWKNHIPANYIYNEWQDFCNCVNMRKIQQYKNHTTTFIFDCQRIPKYDQKWFEELFLSNRHFKINIILVCEKHSHCMKKFYDWTFNFKKPFESIHEKLPAYDEYEPPPVYLP